MTISATAIQGAATLANQFSLCNQAVITFVEQCSADLWQQPCANDGRAVGVVAHHIATSHGVLIGLVGLVAQGQPLPPITQAMLDQGNAHHAEQFAHCTPATVLDLLRANRTTATTLISELSDEQLARSAYVALFATNMTTQQLIENVLIRHARAHLAALQATVAR